MSVVDWAFTTLDEVKTFLGIAGTADDDLLEALIDNASSFIDNDCRRRLKATDYDSAVTADQENCWYDGDASRILILRQYPVNSVSSLVVSGATIDAASVTDYYGSTGYVIYQSRGHLFYGSGFAAGIKNVRVSYNAGYATDSREWYELRQLCQSLVGWVFNNRSHLGFKSERFMNYAYTRGDLKEKWQMETLKRFNRKIGR